MIVPLKNLKKSSFIPYVKYLLPEGGNQLCALSLNISIYKLPCQTENRFDSRFCIDIFIFRKWRGKGNIMVLTVFKT